jgi:LemA protein
MDKTLIAVLAVAGLFVFAILGVIGWVVALYNALVALKNSVDRAWSNIDVVLKQRHDELGKLVEVVKGVRDFEQGTLTKITEARAQFGSATTHAQTIAGAQAETLALKGFFAVAEAYPSLKADENFRQLQTRVSELETQIADRRELYNDTVNLYNTRIEQFPENTLAGMMGYLRRPYFRAEESDLADVQIDFK